MNFDPAAFFAFARERHNIYLRRVAGEPRPWTDDVILQRGRFTNVYRELDKTTVWFKKHVREPLRSKPEVLLATVLFRWFNRITTGEALFIQRGLFTPATAFETFLVDGDIAGLKSSILSYCGKGPYVTGAFIINTPQGMTKLDGVLWAFGEFARTSNWMDIAKEMLREKSYTMENVHGWLLQFPRLGAFMAYEIVTDLRHTDCLLDASDASSWANPGPGAKRGLSYLLGGSRKVVPPNVRSRGQQILLMQQLLAIAPAYGFTDWEMREVEHTLCEFAKYTMVQRGEGQTKGTYK